jgi:hypothetical protein
VFLATSKAPYGAFRENLGGAGGHRRGTGGRRCAVKENDSWIDDFANRAVEKIETDRMAQARTVQDQTRYLQQSSELWERIRGVIAHFRDRFNHKMKSQAGDSDVLVDTSIPNAPRNLSLKFQTAKRRAEITIVMRDHDRQLAVISSIGTAKNVETTFDIVIDGDIARLRTVKGLIPDDQIGRELLASWLDALTREA